MENKNAEDILILNKMYLNKHLSYVDGYINPFCEIHINKNDRKTEKNINKNYNSISDKLNENWDNFTKNIINDSKRFVNMNDLIKSDNKKNFLNYPDPEIGIEYRDIISKIIHNQYNKKSKNINNNTDYDLNSVYKEKINFDNISSIESLNNSIDDLNLSQNSLKNLNFGIGKNSGNNNSGNIIININDSNNNSEEKNNFHQFIINNIKTPIMNHLELINKSEDLIVNDSSDDLRSEKSKKEEKDNYINIKLFLNDNNKSFKLKVNSDKKFLEILSNFLKENNNNNLYIAMHN